MRHFWVGLRESKYLIKIYIEQSTRSDKRPIAKSFQVFKAITVEDQIKDCLISDGNFVFCLDESHRANPYIAGEIFWYGGFKFQSAPLFDNIRVRKASDLFGLNDALRVVYHYGGTFTFGEEGEIPLPAQAVVLTS